MSLMAHVPHPNASDPDECGDPRLSVADDTDHEALAVLRPDAEALYDAKNAREFRDKGPAPRPRDAASLILVRRDGPLPRILLGRRAGGHAFMPDKYVFPGGRVERGDARASAATILAPEAAALAGALSRRPAHALAVAAVRETFEETGLLIARPGAGRGRMGELGFAPHLAPLRFIARAVTPPYRTKRFDARFFLAYAEQALADDRPIVGCGELLALSWLTLEEAKGVDLPNVTRFILGEVAQILDAERPDPRAPFLRWRKGDHFLTRF